MSVNNKVMAIIGSARNEIMGTNEKTAREFAQKLGEELAKADWNLAVYGSDTQFIEYDVVIGYVTNGNLKKESIICYYPDGATVNFAAMQTNPDSFKEWVDTSTDWEVSFYRSLTKVDGVLLFGGAQSTFIAGQIALSRDLPIIAISSFEGAAKIIWKDHLSKKPAFIEDNDIQVMKKNTGNAAADIIASANGQFQRRLNKLTIDEQKNNEFKVKATKWDQYQQYLEMEKKQISFAVVFLALFLISVITGLVTDLSLRIFTVISILSLVIAGGTGATVRMLLPNAPVSGKSLRGPILGIVAGIIFSFLYLLPQLIQGSGILIWNSGNKENTITGPMRIQFVSSLIVAFLAGLGFDFAMGKLLDRSKTDMEAIAKGNG